MTGTASLSYIAKAPIPSAPIEAAAFVPFLCPHADIKYTIVRSLSPYACRGSSIIVTPVVGFRKTSSLRIDNLPLLSIGMGPDPAKGEMRGHAKGVIAIGDMATGWVAIGALARGGVALGGLSFGVVGFRGLSIAAIAFGGLSIGIVAFGGLAIGVVAWGGAAVGYYACGGAAFGQYVIRASTQDPEAVELFGRFMPWLKR